MKKLEDKGKNVPLRYFFGGIKDIAWYVGCVSVVMLLWVACNNGAKTAGTETSDAGDTITQDVDNENDVDDEDENVYVCDECSGNEERKRYTGGHVCASEDGRITIESGYMPCEGNSPECYSRWTFIDEAGKQHERQFENTAYQNRVYPVKKSDGTTYYIVVCYNRSGGEGWNWLEAYKLVGDTIRKVNVADGSNMIKEYEFNVSYYVQSWYIATGGGDCHNWILDYDSSSQNLYRAITNGFDPTDRYEIWHFDGQRFRHKGVAPNRRLHRSLSQYNSLIRYFRTKDYIVRVDSLDTKELRYASWKRPKTMADKPDMVITGGKRLKGVNEVEEWSYDYFSFKSGNGEYLVDCHEVKKKKGGGGTYHKYLIMKRNGTVVLKQEMDE